MRIVEAGQEKLPLDIDDRCLRATPGNDGCVRSDLDDPLAEDGYCLSRRSNGIDRPDLSVGYDEVSGWFCACASYRATAS
jgi:hypothetical protein